MKIFDFCKSILFGLSLMHVNGLVQASPTNPAPSTVRPGCYDYSMLGNSPERLVFERLCDSTDEVDHKAMYGAASRLNAVELAHASALRNDFRLAAAVGGMFKPATRAWTVLGVECNELSDANVALWTGSPDVFPNPISMGLQSQLVRFGRAYNTALLSMDKFPKSLGCKPRAQ